MTNKKLAILALVAVAMSVATTLLYSRNERSLAGEHAVTSLIQGLDPDKVFSIEIKKGSETVLLKRKDKAFLVASKDDYPASNKRINELLIRSLDIRCGEMTTDAEANHEALGVADTSPNAIVLTFKDKDDKILVGYVLGNTMDSGPGAYVRLMGRLAVYSTQGPLRVDTAQTDYMDKEIVAAKKDEVRRVDIALADGSYAIARDKDGRIVLQNIPEGKQPKKSEPERVFDALSRVDLVDVEKAGATALDFDATYTSTLKSGLKYVIKLATMDNTHYATFSAVPPSPDVVKKAQTMIRGEKETDEQLKEREAVLLALGIAKEFSEQHASWVYKISEWKAKALRKPLSELIEDIPKPEAPEKPEASQAETEAAE